MGFWKRTKAEFNRLISLDLHSYWEVFYLDLIVLLLSCVLSFPLAWIADWLGVGSQITEFLNDHIGRPIETNVVKMITPSGFNESTYQLITAAMILSIELILIHLLLCEMYRMKKKSRQLKIRPSADETCDLKLPQYNEQIKKKENEKEEKISLWQSVKSELIRLIRLDFHSYWEVFYLDVIFILFALIISIPSAYLVWYFSLSKIFYPVEYVESAMEASIVRPMAPAGLEDRSYKLITLMAMCIGEIILFHALASLGYYLTKSSNKLQMTSEDVEKTAGCFSGSRIEPKEEKKRPLEKIYESVYTISSSSLFPHGSTEKLIEKSSFP